LELFKENAEEIKVTDAVSPVFDSTSAELDLMFANGSTAASFLLMLYDNKLVPYWQRIKRDAFVNFYLEALAQFPVTGTFESYLFILRAIFGVESEIIFAVPAAGKLEITLNVVNELTFDFIGYDADGEFFIETQDGLYTLAFRGLSGFESDHDLELLFSELVPEGIFYTLFINFYEYSYFVGEVSDVLYDIVDTSGNNIVFYEIGA
jgi:hypothetical protein